MKPVMLIAGAVALLAGCGGGGTTTVINNTTTTTVQASSSTSSTTPSTTTATATDSSGGSGPVVSLKAFQSPSGNIACLITPKFVRCDISERDWSPPPHPSSCPDEVDFGQGIQLPSSGSAEFVCAGDTVLNPQAEALPYGSSSHVGSITCTSAESGMSCENAGGGGFTLSREAYNLN